MVMYDEETLRPLDKDYIWGEQPHKDRRRQHLLLIEPTRHIMLNSAYQPYSRRVREYGFFVYMPTFSDVNCATYRKVDGSEYVVAIRGTKSPGDVGVDIRHFLGIGIGGTPRYMSALQLVQRVKVQAQRENAKVKLTGHSLGGLIAAKINCDLFGGNAQVVAFSPAAQALDKDTYRVYAQPNTFIIAKYDDLISTFVFMVAPGNSFMSTNKYLHLLGDAMFQPDNPFEQDPEIAQLTESQLSDLIDEGQKKLTDSIVNAIPFYGWVSLGLTLTALKYFNENQEKGPVAALQWAEKNTAGFDQMGNQALAMVVGQLVKMTMKMAVEALKLTTSPIGKVVIELATSAVASEAQRQVETIVYASLFSAPTTPFVVCFPPDDEHFEKYDKVGGIKPLTSS